MSGLYFEQIEKYFCIDLNEIIDRILKNVNTNQIDKDIITIEANCLMFFLYNYAFSYNSIPIDNMLFRNFCFRFTITTPSTNIQYERLDEYNKIMNTSKNTISVFSMKSLIEYFFSKIAISDIAFSFELSIFILILFYKIEKRIFDYVNNR